MEVIVRTGVNPYQSEVVELLEVPRKGDLIVVKGRVVKVKRVMWNLHTVSLFVNHRKLKQ